MAGQDENPGLVINRICAGVHLIFELYLKFSKAYKCNGCVCACVTERGREGGGRGEEGRGERRSQVRGTLMDKRQECMELFSGPFPSFDCNLSEGREYVFVHHLNAKTYQRAP